MGLGHQTAHIEVSQGEIFRAFQHQIEPWLLDIGASNQQKCLSREDEVGNEKSTRGNVNHWHKKNWWCSTLGRTTMERHGDFLKHLEISRSNDPWAKKNSHSKPLHLSTFQLPVHCQSYITAILSLHTFIYVIRSYLSQDRTSNNCSKPSSGIIFRNTILSQIKFQMHTPIIIQRLTTSASVRDTPQQGAHTSCHFRSNEKVRWLEPRHSCRLLKLSKGTCRRAKHLGVWCAWLRTSNAKVGECERCRFLAGLAASTGPCNGIGG